MAVQIIESNGVFLERETDAAGRVLSLKPVTRRKPEPSASAAKKPSKAKRKSVNAGNEFEPKPSAAKTSAAPDYSRASKVQRIADFIRFRQYVPASLLSATFASTGFYMQVLIDAGLVEVVSKFPTVYRWKGQGRVANAS